ncbi:MAG TPA: radical SAM protein [Anaerolineaceae bacterium]|nr:radical SAM protein [Anaerolineaceae bacterium]
MTIREIQAKTLLAHVRGEDDYFGLKYNLNLYRGCQHQCIYCDSRSKCYGIEDFRDVLVKANALEVLEKELRRKRVKGTIGFGSMNDPYGPVEKQYNLTGQALQLVARYGFPVHLITKSELVLKDIDTLVEINRQTLAVVSFSFSTADDELARKVEPGASLPSARWRAMAALASRGIHTGVAMMPILPFLEDTPENITAIVEQTAAHGGRYILPWFGMSLREGSREYFYEQLDRLFPGLRSKYEARYGERYTCPAPNARALEKLFGELCARLGIDQKIQRYKPVTAEQLSLF